MSKLDFVLNLTADPNKLIELAIDYQNFVNYLPQQLKSVKILETNNDETITEETITFLSFFKNEIIQQSVHKKIASNKLYTEIISGPFKGSTLDALYEKIDAGTKITINAELKMPLKYKIIGPIIKKYYKTFLTAILFKMNRVALSSR